MTTTKFKMGQRVWILSSKKIDGRYNKGKIVGVELSYDGLGYFSETQYFNDFSHPKYKIAYIDCSTNKACVMYCSESDLQKEKPDV